MNFSIRIWVTINAIGNNTNTEIIITVQSSLPKRYKNNTKSEINTAVTIKEDLNAKRYDLLSLAAAIRNLFYFRQRAVIHHYRATHAAKLL